MANDMNQTTGGRVLPNIDEEALRFFSQLSGNNKDKVIADLSKLLIGQGLTLSDLALTG